MALGKYPMLLCGEVEGSGTRSRPKKRKARRRQLRRHVLVYEMMPYCFHPAFQKDFCLILRCSSYKPCDLLPPKKSYETSWLGSHDSGVPASSPRDFCRLCGVVEHHESFRLISMTDYHDPLWISLVKDSSIAASLYTRTIMTSARNVLSPVSVH